MPYVSVWRCYCSSSRSESPTTWRIPVRMQSPNRANRFPPDSCRAAPRWSGSWWRPQPGSGSRRRSAPLPRWWVCSASPTDCCTTCGSREPGSDGFHSPPAWGCCPSTRGSAPARRSRPGFAVVFVLAVAAGTALALANAFADLQRDGLSGTVSVATVLGARTTLRVDAAILATVQIVALAMTFSAAGPSLPLAAEVVGSLVGLDRCVRRRGRTGTREPPGLGTTGDRNRACRRRVAVGDVVGGCTAEMTHHARGHSGGGTRADQTAPEHTEAHHVRPGSADSAP